MPKLDRKLGQLRSYLLDMPQVLRRGEPPVDEVTLCDLHARQLGHQPQYGLLADHPGGYCIFCGDPQAIFAPSLATGIAEGHELPGPADFDREAFRRMAEETARAIAAGEVPRERALRVYLSNPQLARETGWAALWGIDEPYTDPEYQRALGMLRQAWQMAGDDYPDLLADARRRCTPLQWTDLRITLHIETGIDPGPQGDDHD